MVNGEPVKSGSQTSDIGRQKSAVGYLISAV